MVVMYCLDPPGHDNYDPENNKSGVKITFNCYSIKALFDDCPARVLNLNTNLEYFARSVQ